MILGMTTSTFTFVHVLLSLAGIGSGFIVILGLLSGKRLDGWSAIFLATTVATSGTGFLFPFDHLLPSHKVGILHRDADQIAPIGPSAVLSSKLVKGAIPKVYPGLPHGMCSTHNDQINADLLAFLKRADQVAA
jgi:hypothetical protein